MSDQEKITHYQRRVQAGETLTVAEARDYLHCTTRLLLHQFMKPRRKLLAAIARLVSRPFAAPGHQKVWGAYARDSLRQQAQRRKFAAVRLKAISWMPDRLCIWLFKRVKHK